MKTPQSLADLTDALRCLPGVGPRSAQRMAYYLLQRDKKGAARLAATLTKALDSIQNCSLCNSFSEADVCTLCAASNRDRSLLCVVETPADMLVMEQTRAYRGMYFVVMGRLSPLDGIGPRELQLERLADRVGNGEVREVILATNYTVEGETTAHFIGEMLRARGLKITRIARGVPAGGELEHVDSGTLVQAMHERRVL